MHSLPWFPDRSSWLPLMLSICTNIVKTLRRTRKNRSHLYRKGIKRKIPFQQTSRQKIPFHHPIAYIYKDRSKFF
ncbi:hypothetical protein PRUPE_4G240100 [Prunus persica]|uniref:Uncharacterized protein n=1 Tax=Prunus persica TaxID=3760 RepID=A0A251PQ60_PRUPE|nr:hypothetical protein PRUPE_4G240100 [Prunus persica]